MQKLQELLESVRVLLDDEEVFEELNSQFQLLTDDNAKLRRNANANPVVNKIRTTVHAVQKAPSGVSMIAIPAMREKELLETLDRYDTSEKTAVEIFEALVKLDVKYLHG